MKEQLRYWRDLSKQQKQRLMAKYNIQVITFEQIKMIHEKEQL